MWCGVKICEIHVQFYDFMIGINDCIPIITWSEIALLWPIKIIVDN